MNLTTLQTMYLTLLTLTGHARENGIDTAKSVLLTHNLDKRVIINCCSAFGGVAVTEIMKNSQNMINELKL